MIPILYEPKETDFSHGGIGSLIDTVKCIVTEERNGIFECELQYPVTGTLHNKIQTDCIIVAKPNDTGSPQPFRIYDRTKPISGIVTYFAEHISYQLSFNPIEKVDIKGVSAGVALNKILDAASDQHLYTGISDIETLNSTSLEFVSVRAALGGVNSSVLDVYGGEYEFDVYTIKLHKNRGHDTGILIAYGKNLTDIKVKEDISEVYTAIFPFAKYTPETKNYMGDEPEEIKVTLPEKIIYSDIADKYAFKRILIKDFSDEFENAVITEDMLRNKVTAYLKSGIDEPKINISVSFIHLWQSPEYAKYAPLERVNLCDIVTVRHDDLDIDITAKVIKTAYDVLNEKYLSIELGNARSNFADTLNKQQSEIGNINTKIKDGQSAAAIALQNAIKNATNLITGQNGGYVVLNPPNNPQEILILDKPTVEEATRVWRWNSGGLGYSKNGYNGPYELAMTMDGAIVADYITAGKLNGAIIEADSIKAASLSVEYKSSIEETISQTFRIAEGKLVSEINKKVNDSDLGTKITQNYASVQIAWNNISKYIEFSGGALNIYQSTTQGVNDLLMKLNYSGAWYYYEGSTIGKIGTNSWTGDSTFRGLVFDLEYGSDYMCWAHKTSASASSYTVQMIYYANSKKANQGLHFACNTYAWNNLYINENVRTINYSSGAGGLYSATHEVGLYGASAKLNGGGSVFEVTKSKHILYNSDNNLFDCYNNLDMHNWSILNQSDARFKTNIQSSGVDALNIISQIEIKEFDWIENGEHEDIGIIAQQLRKILPELVDENAETGRLSIKTMKFIPYLLKAIQQLSGHSPSGTKWDDIPVKDKKAFIKKDRIQVSGNKEIKFKKIKVPVKKRRR